MWHEDKVCKYTKASLCNYLVRTINQYMTLITKAQSFCNCLSIFSNSVCRKDSDISPSDLHRRSQYHLFWKLWSCYQFQSPEQSQHSLTSAMQLQLGKNGIIFLLMWISIFFVCCLLPLQLYVFRDLSFHDMATKVWLVSWKRDTWIQLLNRSFPGLEKRRKAVLVKGWSL